jgi:hypothetical protein
MWSFAARKRGQRRREHSKNIDSVLHWKAAGLVGTAQQVLGHNPLETLVLALDAISRAPVRLYRQQREDCIDMTCLDNITASVLETGGGRRRRYGRCVPSCASIVRMGRSFGFSDFSIVFESDGNDAAASFQRTGYQGCRISPPDLAIKSVVHAAQPKLLRREFLKREIGRNAQGPTGRCEHGSRNL